MLEIALETPKMSLNPDENLATVLVMAEELRSLILSDSIFPTLLVENRGGRKKILMSCGGLLARLHRLQCQCDQLTPGQLLVLNIAQKQTDKTKHDLHRAFHHILQREARARLNSLTWFLDEWEQDRAYGYDEYSTEMRNRQRLAEIIKELGDELHEDLVQELVQLDERIRLLCRPASFIWESELEPVYPADRYWYLYLEPEVE